MYIFLEELCACVCFHGPLEAGTQKRNGRTPSLSLEDDSNEPAPQTDRVCVDKPVISMQASRHSDGFPSHSWHGDSCEVILMHPWLAR
jgi:hypothetical protein